jgi:class I fructose-bisphosphate aldolase
MNGSKKISLVLADVDGTLVTQEKVLTERASRAVWYLRERGIRFAITSGRPPRGMQMINDALHLDTPIAGFNGGVFIEPDGKVISSKTISREAAEKALEIIARHQLVAWLYTAEDWYIPDPQGPHVAREAWTVKFEAKVAADFTPFLDHAVKIVGVSDDLDAVAEAEAECQNALKGRVSAVRSQPYYLDVTHPEATKGGVVDYLSHTMRIPPGEIATLGDMPNDVLMFRKSGLSIAMGNASKEVQAQATCVSSSNENEGFAEAVERFILHPESIPPRTNHSPPMFTPRVKEILSWYGSDNPGTLTHLARLLNHGRLAGTGKLVILPVDQGFEHGPGRSFAMNPPAYNPHYHFQLAIEAGVNAYAAPLGFLESGARDFAGEVPLILKVNDHDVLLDEKDPMQALTGSVEDALRLGAVGIGFTIYPGSSHRLELYGQIRAYAAEAKKAGLVVVIWSYPRGSGLSKEGETAIDVTAYAAHIAAQLGAHIIKVKLPTAHIEQDAARKVYEKEQIPIGTMAERVRHVVQSTFDGRRVLIFSGGPADETATFLEEVQAIHDGGGFGSIVGRNSFQRKKPEALKFLSDIIGIYAGA